MAEFPRFFQHTNPPTSDALLVRFDDAESDCVVVTTSGAERLPHHSPWPLENCLLMVALGDSREITKDEASQLLSNARKQK